MLRGGRGWMEQGRLVPSLIEMSHYPPCSPIAHTPLPRLPTTQPTLAEQGTWPSIACQPQTTRKNSNCISFPPVIPWPLPQPPHPANTYPSGFHSYLNSLGKLSLHRTESNKYAYFHLLLLNFYYPSYRIEYKLCYKFQLNTSKIIKMDWDNF